MKHEERGEIDVIYSPCRGRFAYSSPLERLETPLEHRPCFNPRVLRLAMVAKMEGGSKAEFGEGI